MKEWIEKMKGFRGQLDNPVYCGLSLFLVVLVVLGIFDMNRFDGGKWGADWDGILTEAHGMLMDILIFGVLLTWFDRMRSRKNEIKNYHDQLNIFWDWGEKEGIKRKVGIIKSLVQMGEGPLELPLIHLQKSNLSHENLMKVDLLRADLSGAKLSGTNLYEANLTKADLRWSDLSHASLKGATLSDADLIWANLSHANLNRANLCHANLSGANLSRADLSHANLNGANLSEANFSGAKNLTCDQILSTYIDKKTKFPDYIEITWADEDTYTCAMVGEKDDREG